MSQDPNVQIPFLTPVDGDDFTEMEIRKHTYHVSYNDPLNFVKVRINNDNIGISFTLLPGCQWTDEHHFQKLIGYIMFKIMPRYARN